LDVNSLVGRVVLQDESDSTIIPATVTTINNNQVIKVTPDALLTAGRTYRVNLDHRILDTDGDRQISNRSSRFTTSEEAVEDNQQPQVVAISPPNGAVDVPLNPRYHVRFDERVNSLAVMDEVGMDISVSSNAQEILYTRYAPLLEDAEVTEIVPKVEDVSGNALIDAQTVFHTMKEPSFVGPRMVSSTPVNSSTVPVNATF